LKLGIFVFGVIAFTQYGYHPRIPPQALLEKNEDLSKQNEKIAEEFSQKLEVRDISIIYQSLKNVILYASRLCHKNTLQKIDT
jgi:hypothetical protein